MNAPAQSAPNAAYKLTDRPVNANLGSVGRVEAHRLSDLGPYSSLGRDEFYVVSTASAGLPHPGSGLDAHVLTVAECPSLVVIAGVRGTCAYHVIVDLGERAALAALKGVLKQGSPLNFVLVTDSKPAWSGFYFETPEQLKQLGECIERAAFGGAAPGQNWRDRLGLLLLELPARLAAVEPRAATCEQHAVVLASSARAEHERQVDRLAEAFGRWKATSAA